MICQIETSRPASQCPESVGRWSHRLAPRARQSTASSALIMIRLFTSFNLSRQAGATWRLRKSGGSLSSRPWQAQGALGNRIAMNLRGAHFDRVGARASSSPALYRCNVISRHLPFSPANYAIRPASSRKVLFPVTSRRKKIGQEAYITSADRSETISNEFLTRIRMAESASLPGLSYLNHEKKHKVERV
jgi:hypothetical protein